jgi:uncharacterized protein YcbK (DUF882 family)
MLLHRRQFLAGLAVLLPLKAWSSGTRRLAFNHLHTGETLAVDYAVNGRYCPEALIAVNRLLRDFRTGDVHEIDPVLLDILHDVRTTTGTSVPFQVVSGYRSPATNRRLAATRGGVAVHSLHLTGQAIDVRLPGVSCAALKRAAVGLRAGGVGYYPDSDFVHLDTGRVRYW